MFKDVLQECEPQDLFPGSACYVTVDPISAGFDSLYMPDAFRHAVSHAYCYYPLQRLITSAHPVLIIRVNRVAAHWGPHLTPLINGVPLQTRLISRYGTYYFDIEPVRRKIPTTDRPLKIELLINAIASTQANDEGFRLPVYQIDIIDLEKNEFDERHYFYNQIKVFLPEGGFEFKLLQQLRLSPGARVLDIGAGDCWTTALLAARFGLETWGIDMDQYDGIGQMSWRSELYERMMRHIPLLNSYPDFQGSWNDVRIKQTIERCHFQSMDAESLAFRDGYFDFIFSLNAFEHIMNPERALAEIERVLKPGGQALLSFQPLYYSDDGGHLGACGLLQTPWAHLTMTRDEIKQEIMKHGGVPNEVDNILNSLNKRNPSDFLKMFQDSPLLIVESDIRKGFVLSQSASAKTFQELGQNYPEDHLTTIGMAVLMKKKGGE